MDNQVIFKNSAFGGFDKKEVMTYIYELTSQSQSEQEGLNHRIEELLQERDALQQQLGLADSRIRTLETHVEQTSSELTGEKARVMEMNESIAKLTQDQDRQKEMLAARERQVSEAQNRQVEMAQRIRELEKSSADVEAAKLQIGSLLMDATTKSDQIIAAAHEKAEETVQEAQQRADTLMEEANVSLTGIYRQFNSLHDQIKGIKAALTESISTMTEQVELVDELVQEAESSLEESCLRETAPALVVEEELETPEDEQSPDYPEHEEHFFRVAADE
ncbi:hypothetical protein U6B65_14150 [Oscillospiraceae bacterium MB08-C2-2]|nr:hypothetical protein U6B65_14150 [Oscillospiraceae bacterium MB08-C2-2]